MQHLTNWSSPDKSVTGNSVAEAGKRYSRGELHIKQKLSVEAKARTPDSEHDSQELVSEGPRPPPSPWQSQVLSPVVFGWCT